MKTVSSTLKPGSGPCDSSCEHASARPANDSRDRSWFAITGPPNVRGRRREARRWLDELSVRCYNGRSSQRRPGDRLLTLAEGRAMADALYAALERDDPALFLVVERVSWEERMQYVGISLAEWLTRSHRRGNRIAKVRADMQRTGLV